MEFVHDVGADLKRFMAAFRAGEQIGLARFGDGEECMYRGGKYHCSDGWVSAPSKTSRYRKKLAEAIRFSHPAYYVGMRYPRSLKLWAWTARNVTTPPERVCDPCLFVNSRWSGARKFFAKQRKRCYLVGSGKGVNFRIPKNCIQPEYKYAKLLKTLLTVKKPILLAAGPLANILVMEYLRAGGKQSIIDIGTVLDMELFGHATRRYMRMALAKKGRRKGKRKRPKPVAAPKRRKRAARKLKKKRKRKGRRRK